MLQITVYHVLDRVHVQVRGTLKRKPFETAPREWPLLDLTEYESPDECPDIALGQAIAASLSKIEGYAGNLIDFIEA